MKTVLIFGRTGQIGWELQQVLPTLGKVVALGRSEIDLANPEAIRQVIRDLSPQIIVNAAAYTTVDKAESEQEIALTLNGKAPAVMAEEAKRLGSIFVHYSTDYVYDGESQRPYLESDTTGPLNVYGRSKLAGDHAVEMIGGSYLILRTSWVYGMRGHNFLQTMLKLAKERDYLKIVADQVGAPTWSRLIAQATADMLTACNQDTRWGTYHLTCGGQTSWHGFAESIFERVKRQGLRAPQLTAIKSSEYASPAQRPKNSVLSNEKVAQAFGVRLPSWDVGLSMCLHSSL